MGTKANYIIAEVEFREGEDPHKENEEEEEDIINGQQVCYLLLYYISLLLCKITFSLYKKIQSLNMNHLTDNDCWSDSRNVPQNKN